jgi:Fic family protein
MHKVKEATNSTRIEGTQTLIDEAVLSQKEIQPEKVNDWQEVQNYLKAIDFAIERMDELPLSIRLVKEIHTQLLDDVRGQEKMPGTIRTSQNWIGGANLNSAVFVPPHQLELATLLSDLEKFWHNEEWKVPPLIKIAISHYQFETIHPFLDGNGRTGRLLITLQLLHYGLLDTPTLYLSAFFEQHRGEYVDALLRTSISHDIDQWIRFFLTGIIESAIHSKTTFIAIDQLRVNYNARIENLGRRKKLALKLMNHLYSKPIVSSKDVQAFLEVTPATADRLIKALEDESILVEKTGYARNRLFVLKEYLKLFK